MRILIGTTGFSYEDWNGPNVFYQSTTDTLESQLCYYMTRFDMLTISSTYESQPCANMYTEWANLALKTRKDFSFVVIAPKKFTDSHSISSSIREWTRFWNGYTVRTNRGCERTERKGECKILFDKGVLGCVVLQFPGSFHYNDRHLNKILKITKLIPPTLKLSFEFLHSSWREERSKIAEMFRTRPSWCISTPFVENGLVDFGWAGNIKSTRTHDAFTANSRGPSVLLTTDFVHISLCGTLGPHIGSYDRDGFLERFSVELKKLESAGVKTAFCSFDATTPQTTFCNPLPGMVISGFFLNPKISDLPSHTSVDRPCCLHDAIRLQELLRSTRKYKRDSEGFVEIEFK